MTFLESDEAQVERWRNSIPYAVCAGIRVPLSATPSELEDALRRRKIRFTNETQIVNEYLAICQKRRNANP